MRMKPQLVEYKIIKMRVENTFKILDIRRLI